jgi:hypothetical protein
MSLGTQESSRLVDLGSINASTLPFGLDPELPAELLNSGFNSRAYRVGDLGEQVVKISRFSIADRRIDGLLDVMRSEGELTCEFVGSDSMPATRYGQARDQRRPRRTRAITHQGYVEGEHIKDYLSRDGVDVSSIVIFLEAALRMYEKTRKVPDLANIQQGFNVLVNSNVLMSPKEDGVVIPILVDTNFGSIQRSRPLSRVWSRGIAGGVRRALDKLEQR